MQTSSLRYGRPDATTIAAPARRRTPPTGRLSMTHRPPTRIDWPACGDIRGARSENIPRRVDSMTDAGAALRTILEYDPGFAVDPERLARAMGDLLPHDER